MDGLLYQSFIYLAAAVIAVPLAKRIGLGSVLGYLIAGILIGPVIGLVGSETEEVQHFAEFGVVMMLFLVGLELKPRELWAMRHRLLGLGGLQVLLSTLVGMAISMLFGLPWTVSLTIGLVLSLSSTAIVLQTLTEKGLLRSEAGQSSFSVLLFQDIAVIPILALVPLLALPELVQHANTTGTASEHEDAINLVSGLVGWQVAVVYLGVVAFVIVGGHFLSRPLFRFIAKTRLREVFTAAALLLVIGIALLMSVVGLSPALGTFLAGVVLADSEYRHELESDIEPFKGLLLGLFFITVGAGIDFALLFDQLGLILGLTLLLIGVKFVVLFGLGWIFRLSGTDRWLFALGLSQAGEFGFVLLSFSVDQSVLAPDIARVLLLVVALSMLLTPVLFLLFEKIILPKLDQQQTEDAHEITEQGTVIIAGHGRFGQIVNRVLLANGFKTVVLDTQADLVEGMRRFGVRTFFGDATRLDLLHSAGLDDAKVLVIAIDDADRTIDLVETIKREKPDLHVVARAFDRQHVYRLYRAGANDIVRETFDSSVRAARSALEALGLHPYDAEKAVTSYVQHDRERLRRLASVWDPEISVYDNEAYLTLARQINRELESAVEQDRTGVHERGEPGWRSPVSSHSKDNNKKDND